SDELGVHPILFRPRRPHPHRRADGDDDDRERLLRHHAEPAQERRRAHGGQEARSEMGEDVEDALDPQQLHHAARHLPDAVEPLPDDLREPEGHPRDRYLRHRRGRDHPVFLQCVASRSREGAVVGLGGRGARDRLRFLLRGDGFARDARTDGTQGASDYGHARRRTEGAAGGGRHRDGALHDVPCAGADGGDRRSAEGGGAGYARAHRPLRAGDPDAGRADPCDAPQQFHPDDGRGADAAGALAQPRSGAEMTAPLLSDAELAVGRKLMARLDAFAAFTDEPGRLTRLFLSDAHKAAALAFIGWSAEAGLDARIDAAGNVVARYEGRRAGAPALMLGSHIDTVRDAGRYDGNYGALAALAVVEALAARGERLEHAVEIVAFGDEEGVRFRTTLTGSRALAGIYPREALDQKDSGGVLMRDALKAFGGDPDAAGSIRANNVAAFVEAHIEQGPLLEAEGLPLGVVSAINGATRLEVGVDGTAGHAGATPMALRRDALTAAAEMALAIEARARREADLVATVGRLEVWPGATNVIPGHVQFSIDLRAPDDARRGAALADLKASIHSIAVARGVRATVAKTHEANAFVCDPRIVAGLTRAVAEVGVRPRILPSGAGHDTMVMGGLCPAGML